MSASIGNTGSSISETRSYDGRLRLTNITDGSLYTVTIPTSGGYAPNSDTLLANDSVNGNWTYGYDAFNRLAGAGATGQSYTYDYDRFGNRWHQNGPHSSSVSFGGNNNRMDTYSYDAAGNLLNDGTTTYTYDSESRIITATNSTSGTSTYLYDTDGRRVRKTTAAGGSVDFLYDLAGHEIAQVSSAGAWTRGEIYAGSRHLGTYSGGTGGSTYFTFSDWLGTERARSTSTGAPYETCTSLPFGDWLTCTGSDPSPMHFTGKERDTESGLDDFGARYYSSQYGRFMSSDWSAIPVAVPYANLTNPQTLNLYAIVSDNPETFADLDGHSRSDFLCGFYDNWYNMGAVDTNTIPFIPNSNQGSDQAQNNTTGRQPDGSYVADLKSKEIAALLDPNHKPSKSDVVGPNGECVDLTKKFSGMSKDDVGTYQWKVGSKVDKDTKPGTAIATFNDKGRYPSKHGWNSGIYLGPGDHSSFWVLDQWPGHSPTSRQLYPDSNAARPENAGAYSVILVEGK